MSYSMGPISTLAVHINDDYLNALRKDVELYENKDIRESFLSRFEENAQDLDQKDMFLDIVSSCDAAGLDDLEFVSTLNDNIRYIDYEENYAYMVPVDLSSGRGKWGDDKCFEGYVYPFEGIFNLYQPPFKDKVDLINYIKKYLYIPTTFNLEKNIIYITGVYGG